MWRGIFLRNVDRKFKKFSIIQDLDNLNYYFKDDYLIKIITNPESEYY